MQVNINNINQGYQSQAVTRPIYRPSIPEPLAIQPNLKASLYQMLNEIATLMGLGQRQYGQVQGQSGGAYGAFAAAAVVQAPQPKPKVITKVVTKVVEKVVEKPKPKRKRVDDELPVNERNGHDESDGQSGQDGDSTNATDADNGTRD